MLEHRPAAELCQRPADSGDRQVKEMSPHPGPTPASPSEGEGESSGSLLGNRTLEFF